MKRIVLICSCLLLLQSASLLPKSLHPSLAKSPSVSEPNPSTLDHGGKIETKYDGFNRETVVTLKKMRINCEGARGFRSTLKQTCVSIVASLHCPGTQLDFVRYAKFQLVFETKDWDNRHPLDERELFVVADGQRLKLGRMGLVTQDLASNQGIDRMNEVLEVTLSYNLFNTIAGAKTIEMMVGKSVFALQERNLEALRDLNIRVRL